MDNGKYIVGIGEVLFDCLPSGEQLGGAPANFAYHASQLGFHGIAISAVGHDALGDAALHILSEKSLDCHLERVPFPTGTVQVTLARGGVPTYDIHTDVAFDHIPFTPEIEHIAHHTQCVCFGTLAQRSEVSRHTIQRFLQSTPATALKVFDINLRQGWYTTDVIEQSLQLCDVLKLNDEEMGIVAKLLHLAPVPAPPAVEVPRCDDFEKKCRMLLDAYHLRIVIITCGKNGSYILTPDAVSYLPTPKVAVADTVGAGDAFTGAFCAELLSGKSISAAHRKAVDVSAYVCTQPGAMPQGFRPA